jgi:hypothetical protein
MNFTTNIEDAMVGVAHEVESDEDLLAEFVEANSNSDAGSPPPTPAQQPTKALSAYEEQLLEIEREKLAMLKANQQQAPHTVAPELAKYEFKTIDAEAASDVAGYVQHETARVRAQMEAESRALREELETRNRDAAAAAETARLQRQSEVFAQKIEHGTLFKGQTVAFRQAVATLQKPENAALWQGVTAAMHSDDVGTAEELFRLLLKKGKRPMSTASVSTQGGGGNVRSAPQQDNNVTALYSTLLAAEKAMHSQPYNIARYNAHQVALTKYLEAVGG